MVKTQKHWKCNLKMDRTQLPQDFALIHTIFLPILSHAMVWIKNFPGPWPKAGKDNPCQTPGLSITPGTYLVSNDQNHLFDFVPKLVSSN